VTRISSTTASRTIISALATLVLATVSSHATFAGTLDSGIWEVNSAQSSFNSSSATLTLERANGLSPARGPAIVIFKGNIYLVRGATASNGSALKLADYANTKDGKSVLIGTQVRSEDPCSFRCIQGAQERRMTVTFSTVNGGQQIRDMLAYNGPK